MASALFQLSPDGGVTWLPAGTSIADAFQIPYAASGTRTVKARLSSLAGAGPVTWDLVSKSDLAPTPAITSLPGEEISFVVVRATAATWLLRARILGGQKDEHACVLAVKVALASGTELLAPGERDEGYAIFGWSRAYNQLARQADAAGGGVAAFRLNPDGLGFKTGDVTLGAGDGITISAVGNAISLSTSGNTRINPNSTGYLGGDIAINPGTGITFGVVGSTITINGSGGSALPSPYTATIDGSGNLLITGPDVNAIGAPPPSLFFKGRKNTDATDGRGGGNVFLSGGDSVSDFGGTGYLEGGNAPEPGGGVTRGGATTVNDGTAGGATLEGRSGPDAAHAALTNVSGGGATVRAGSGKGTGVGANVRIIAGETSGGAGVGGDVNISAGSAAARVTVKKGSFWIEDATSVAKQGSATALLTTATTTATLAYSYALGTSENATITVSATADNGTTTGNVIKKAIFRRAVADNAGAANQQGGGATADLSVVAFKLSHDVTIALNGNTIEVKAVAAAATSTLWTVCVSVESRTGPV